MDYLNDSLTQNLCIKKAGNRILLQDTIRIAGKADGIWSWAFDIINGSSTNLRLPQAIHVVNGRQTYSLAVDLVFVRRNPMPYQIIDYSTRQLRQQEIVRLWADPEQLAG
jgi:hypothetical protein